MLHGALLQFLKDVEWGALDVLFAAGGNFLDVLPDPHSVAPTLGQIPLRAHMDITVSSQMLVPPTGGGAVLLLPAATRYEVPGGLGNLTFLGLFFLGHCRLPTSTLLVRHSAFATCVRPARTLHRR